MLRALAQASGGTYEFFDTKMKHTWAEKVRRLRSIIFSTWAALRLDIYRLAGNFRCALRFSVWSLQAADQWQ